MDFSIPPTAWAPIKVEPARTENTTSTSNKSDSDTTWIHSNVMMFIRHVSLQYPAVTMLKDGVPAVTHLSLDAGVTASPRFTVSRIIIIVCCGTEMTGGVDGMTKDCPSAQHWGACVAKCSLPILCGCSSVINHSSSVRFCVLNCVHIFSTTARKIPNYASLYNKSVS